jgi:hypothetical protein
LDIGDEDEEFTVEPVEDPFRKPVEVPETAPLPDPVKVPERVPA